MAQRPPMGQLPLMQLGYDAAQLMAQEYRTMTMRRRRARIADLEARLADNPLPGFHQVKAALEYCTMCMCACVRVCVCTMLDECNPSANMHVEFCCFAWLLRMIVSLNLCA